MDGYFVYIKIQCAVYFYMVLYSNNGYICTDAPQQIHINNTRKVCFVCCAVLAKLFNKFCRVFFFCLLLIVEEVCGVSEQYPSIYDEKWTYSQVLGNHIWLFKLSWYYL